MADRKQSLRTRIRAARRARTAQARRADAGRLADLVLALPEISRARRIATYASMPHEPGTEPLREALRARGVQVLLPLPGPDHTLDWAWDDGRTLDHPGPGGPLPAGRRLGPQALAQADAVIVPALAVDTTGVRLGQGGGYFDRALAKIAPTIPVIALVHPDELLDATTTPLPRDPHDHPIRLVVTPERVHRISARPE